MMMNDTNKKKKKKKMIILNKIFKIKRKVNNIKVYNHKIKD